MFDSKINLKTLFIFRVFFAVFGFLFCINSIEFIPYRWPHVNNNIIYFLHACWIILSLLLLLGIGGRIRNIFHFLVVLYLLHPDIGSSIGFSVQETTYLLPSFWLIFINVDTFYRINFNKENKYKLEWKYDTMPLTRIDYIGIWSFGVNWGVILLFASMCKIFDPYWVQGLGFYFTSYLPWIKGANSTYILESFSFLKFLNFGSEIIQGSFLLTFLIPRLRFIACFYLIYFFGGLIYPLRIDFIGEIGISYTFLLLSITRIPYLNNLDKASVVSPNTSGFHLFQIQTIRFFLVLIVVFFCSILFERFNYNIYDYKRQFNLKMTAEDSMTIKYRKKFIYKTADKATRYLNNSFLYQFQHATVWMQNWHLFTSRHVMGIYEYRLIFKNGKQEVLEPYNVFNEDMTGGKYTTGFVPRYLQASIYPISDLSHRLTMVPNYIPTSNETEYIENLINFQKRKVPADYNTVELLVRKINMPLEYVGSTKVYLSGKWELLYSANIPNKTGRWYIPTPFERQARVPGLPNFEITNKIGL